MAVGTSSFLIFPLLSCEIGQANNGRVQLWNPQPQDNSDGRQLRWLQNGIVQVMEDKGNTDIAKAWLKHLNVDLPKQLEAEVLFCRGALQAVQLGYVDVLDYLVRNQKLDLGVADEKNRNLLFLATIYDQSKILDYFLEMTLPVPDVNQAAENGNTPLHAAVNTGKMHLVSLLLHYPGINVNVPNPQCEGATALHVAIAYGHLGICYLLLNASADVESPMEGLTPLQLAEMFGNETVIGLIKMHVKKFKLESSFEMNLF